MGITIHYRGRINPALAGELIDDVKDICYQHGWGFTVFRDGEVTEQEKAVWKEEKVRTPEEEAEIKSRAVHIEDTVPLTGIVLDVEEECEGVWLLFDAKGDLFSLIGWILQQDGTLSPDSNWVSTKTQFSSLQSHVLICELLRYLQRKYFVELEVNDEGEYWETGDMDALYNKRKFLGAMIDLMAEALRHAEPLSEEERENPELLMKRIADIAEEFRQREGIEGMEIREIKMGDKEDKKDEL